MLVEKPIDLEQQKRFLTYVNKELKSKVVVLENQKDVLVDVLGSSAFRKTRKTGKRSTLYILVVSGIFLACTIVFASYLQDTPETETPLKTRYLTENIRGDTVDTWKFWKIDSESTLVVSIVNADQADKNRINVIKDAILSDEEETIDDSLTHKGPVGYASTYHIGWKGALEKASKSETKYPIPTRFKIVESGDVGNIVITLSAARDQDGYSGYTKSTVDGNEILKSQITIYDVNSLSDDMLAAIIRHEFGHAIGLGHSTAPEDLMAPSINMQAPYISECDVNAVAKLYDGATMTSTVCEK